MFGKKNITDIIIEKNRDTINPLIQALMKGGMIPYKLLDDRGNFKFGFIVYGGFMAKRYNPMGERAFRVEVSAQVGYRLKSEDFEDLLIDATLITSITSNPFLSTGFYSEQEDLKEIMGVQFNEVLKSKYDEMKSPVFGGERVDLLLKVIRGGDENKIEIDGNVVSFFEVGIAHQMFHSSKIMWIGGLVSDMRGQGKTFLMSLADRLVSTMRGDGCIGVVNMADPESAKWGDDEIGKRGMMYDDLPEDKEVVNGLMAKFKSLATSWKPLRANVKGQGKVLTNAYNLSFATNFESSVPMEKGLDSHGNAKDRRVYPVLLSDTYTAEELKEISNFNLPRLGKPSPHNVVMQELINHLFYVYEMTKDDKIIDDFLNERVPNSGFRNQIASGLTTRNKRVENIITISTSQEEIVETLADKMGVDLEDVERIFNGKEIEVHTVKGVVYCDMSNEAIKALAGIFTSNDHVSLMIAKDRFFKGLNTKVITINGSSKRGFRVPMPKATPVKNAKDIIEELKKGGNVLFE